MLKHKNILIKVAGVEFNIFTDERIFYPTFSRENDPIVYSEFEKILNDKNILGSFLPGENRINFGHTISELKVGKVFSIYQDIYENRITFLGRMCTSPVREIFTPNLFLTNNSLYFIKDESYQISLNREQKLNQILL
jgi:hypothetical protein